MPYISHDRRKGLKPKSKDFPECAGDLNYQITMLLLDYLKFNGKQYSHFNDIIGALEGAKLEFYRRHVVPYENQKIVDNGDVT